MWSLSSSSAFSNSAAAAASSPSAASRQPCWKWNSADEPPCFCWAARIFLASSSVPGPPQRRRGAARSSWRRSPACAAWAKASAACSYCCWFSRRQAAEEVGHADLAGLLQVLQARVIPAQQHLADAQPQVRLRLGFLLLPLALADIGHGLAQRPISRRVAVEQLAEVGHGGDVERRAIHDRTDVGSHHLGHANNSPYLRSRSRTIGPRSVPGVRLGPAGARPEPNFASFGRHGVPVRQWTN